MTIIIDGTVGANKAVVLDSSGKLPTIDGSLVTTLNATQVTTGTIATARLDTGTTTGKVLVLDGSGNMPAIAAGSMTGVSSATKSASDPTISTNPSTGLGTKWINTTSGEIFILTDATAGENVWTSTGGTSGDVVPIKYTGDRGCFPGGFVSNVGNSNVIDYVAIPTLGNAVDFGDLTVGRQSSASCSNGARGLCAAGQSSKSIDYWAFSTLGNAADFGDLDNGTASWYGPAGASNGIRGVFMGGTNGSSAKTNLIDYVTIATLGDSTDFGNITTALNTATAMASLTRALIAGGNTGSVTNTIEYITVANTGNATDFGDLTQAKNHSGACSSLTRGIVAGGTTGSPVNVIEYVTMATTGNAIDFGDLTGTDHNGTSGLGNVTRGLFAGGSSPQHNRIDYITIATLGAAADFGDMSVTRQYAYGCSGD